MISNYNKQVGDYYDIDSKDFDKGIRTSSFQKIRQDFKKYENSV